MSEINLLPKKEQSSKQTQRISTFITRVAIAVGFIVIAAAILGGGTLFFVNRDYQNAQNEYDQLFARVKDLEGTEFNLLLTKERLAKIAPFLEARTAYDAIDRYSEIVNTLPENAAFSSLELGSDISELTLTSTDSDTLATIMKSLQDINKYDLTIIDKLKFNQTQGFELSVQTN